MMRMKLNNNLNFDVVLASQSPRRIELLEKLNISFKVKQADVDELKDYYLPALLVVKNADLKSESISSLFPDSLVLGADTVVELGSEVLGKPTDYSAAFNMLKKLSGRKHQVTTAVSLKLKSKNINCNFAVTTDVSFKTLSDEVINEYLELEKPYDKAGSYGIQSNGDLLIEAVDGDIDNVIGLPCNRLMESFFYINMLT